ARIARVGVALEVARRDDDAAGAGGRADVAADLVAVRQRAVLGELAPVEGTAPDVLDQGGIEQRVHRLIGGAHHQIEGLVGRQPLAGGKGGEGDRLRRGDGEARAAQIGLRQGAGIPRAAGRGVRRGGGGSRFLRGRGGGAARCGSVRLGGALRRFRGVGGGRGGVGLTGCGRGGACARAGGTRGGPLSG